MGTIIFYPVNLEFDPLLGKTSTLLITFEQWVLELWYFTWLFPVMRPFRGYHYFWYFWTVRAIALIFHTNIPCDKTFSWVPLFFNLWHWPWRLTYFLKTLTLIISFEQWDLDIWYFTWVFLEIWYFTWAFPCDPFRGYHYFFLMNIRAFILHMSISCDNIFLLVSRYLSFWPWPSSKFMCKSFVALQCNQSITLFFSSRGRNFVCKGK